MLIVSLKDLQFTGFHGCYAEEQIVGNPYKINISLHTKDFKPCKTDNIEHAINYQNVYQIIKLEMKTVSNLIENVAWRIIKAMFTQFGQVEKMEIELSKINPSIPGSIDSSQVIIAMTRKEWETYGD